MLIGPRRRSRDGVQAEVSLRLEVGSPAVVQRSSDVSHFRVVRVNWFQRSHRARSSLGIQRELTEFGSKCVLDSASDSQCVIGHSRLRGHSVASKHVEIGGLWLQEAITDKKLALEKVQTRRTPRTCVPNHYLESGFANCVALLAYSFVTVRMPLSIQGAGLCLGWTRVALERDSVMTRVFTSHARVCLKARVDLTCFISMYHLDITSRSSRVGNSKPFLLDA